MKIGIKSRRAAAGLPLAPSSSSPSPLLVFPRQDSGSSSSCISTCPPPDPCPTCPQGQVCTQISRSCESCGSNVCRPDPEYKPPSKSSSSPLGGVLGGVLAVIALAIVAYFIWNRRKKKKLELQRKIRNETKVKEAGVAFRPKRKSKSGEIENHSEGGGGVAIEMNDQRRSEKSMNGSNGDLNANDQEEVIEDEEDTEWTEMRSDGLTVYKRQNGMSEKEAEEEYLRNLEAKRYSSGAATHLSRITEGIEEEDEVASLRTRASSLHPLPPPLPPLNHLTNNKSHSHSSSINLDPGNSNARSRKSRSDFNGFSPNSNPFSDSASENSPAHMNGSSPITTPDPVHRPAGAPLVDLQSGKSPSRRGSLAPSTSSASSSSNNHGNGSSNSGHSSNGRGITRNLLSPNVNKVPTRPSRAPDLNLRLADGAEPGQSTDSRLKVGLGIDHHPANSSQRESSATFESYDTDGSGRPMSPAAASSNFHHSSSHSTLKSPLSPNNMISPNSQQQRFDFMSVDPSSSSGANNFSSALESSNVYSRNDDRRLSSATVGTLGTMHTTASDYVLSKPQIMTLSSASPTNANPGSNASTPASLQSRGGSPVVIRPTNSGNKPQVLKNLAQAKERGLLRTSPRGTPRSEVSNPFSDENRDVEFQDDGFESSASSLAPRIRNPFSDDHSSELEEDFRSISDVDGSRSASRALSPAGTFGDGGSKPKSPSRSGASRYSSSNGGSQTPNTFGGGIDAEDLDDNDHHDHDFLSEMNGRVKNRNTFKSNNRDSTATFQTVASGFSMGIPFIDVNKTKDLPLRNPESSSPRDEKESYDSAEVSGNGERSSWLSQSPSISSKFNRNPSHKAGFSANSSRGKGKETLSPSAGNGSSSSAKKSSDSERASMISYLSSNDEGEVVINQAEKVDLKRTDSAKRFEYEAGRNGKNRQESRIDSMNMAPNSRQSNASSIGGLSAFDFAPMMEEDNQTMPKDAIERAQSHRSNSQQQQPRRRGDLSPNRELNSPLQSPDGVDGSFEEEEFLRDSSGNNHDGDVGTQHGRNHSGSMSGNKINTGADPETVEQIRLTHELSNYPFQMG